MPKFPMTGLKLKGVTPATNQEKARISRRQKTVFRLPAVLIFFSQSNFASISLLKVAKTVEGDPKKCHIAFCS